MEDNSLRDPSQYKAEVVAATAFTQAPYRRKITSHTSVATSFFRKKRTNSKSLDREDARTCHQLAMEGDLNGLKSAIEALGFTLKELDDHGATLLHSAAKTNQVKVMLYLIESGVALNAQDEDGNTALHIAVQEGHIDALHLLLKNGASDVILNSKREAPIHNAAQSGAMATVVALLEHPIEILVPGFRQRNALHIAAELDQVEVCEVIHNRSLLRGSGHFKLCATDEDDLTPIHLAARKGSHRVLDFFMKVCTEHGYSNDTVISFLDEENSTPLHAAVDGGHTRVVEVLLKRGASPLNSKDGHPPPLHMACSRGKLEIVKVMVDRCGCAILHKADEYGRTPLHFSANSANSAKLIPFITQYNVDINSTDNQNRTALHIAVMSGSLSAVQHLLSKGADPTIRDRNGHNTLHYAVIHNRKAIICHLMELPCARALACDISNCESTPVHCALKLGYGDLIYPMVSVIGAEIENMVDSQGNNLLHLAAGSGDCSVLANLFNVPACEMLLNEVNQFGSTPLHCAAEAGHTGCVKVLLAQGATSHKCHCGFTPFMRACSKGHTTCAKLLHEAFPFQRDWTDDKGNTCLHLAVSSSNPQMVKLVLDLGTQIAHNFDEESFFDLIIRNTDTKCAVAVINHDRWQECLDTTSPHYPHPMLGLIHCMPDIAKLILNRSHVTSTYDKAHPQYWEKFCFKYVRLDTSSVKQCSHDHHDNDVESDTSSIEGLEIPSIQYKGYRKSVVHAPPKVDLNSTQALQTMVKYQRIALLTHPVVSEYLRAKWRDYGRILYSSVLLLHILHIFFLSIFIAIVPLPESESSSILNASGNGSTSTEDYELTPAANGIRILILLLCTINVLSFMAYACVVGVKGLHFLRSPISWAHFGTILCTYIFLIPYTPLWPAGAIASFCGWFTIVVAMQLFDVIGIYVTMFLRICRTVLIVMIISFILLLSFSLSLYLLAFVTPGFSNVGYSLFTSFGYMLGEIQYDQLVIASIAGSYQYSTILFIFIIALAILMSIVMINLLIGLAVGDIEKIRLNATAEAVSAEINFFTRIDAALPKQIIKRYDRHCYKKCPNAHQNRLRKFLNAAFESFKNIIENHDEVSERDSVMQDQSVELAAMRQQLQELTGLVRDLKHQRNDMYIALQHHRERAASYQSRSPSLSDVKL